MGHAKPWTVMGCLLLCAPICAALAAAPSAESTQAELRQVRGRIDSIRKAINEDVQRRDAVTVQLKDTEIGIQTAQQRLAATRRRP